MNLSMKKLVKIAKIITKFLVVQQMKLSHTAKSTGDMHHKRREIILDATSASEMECLLGDPCLYTDVNDKE